MNYIQEINAFYEWLETNTLPRAAIALWNALMNVNNRTMWQPSFEVAMSTLETKTGCSRKELYTARTILTEKGRISWQVRGGHLSAVYSIIPFGGRNASADNSPVHSCPAKSNAVPFSRDKQSINGSLTDHSNDIVSNEKPVKDSSAKANPDVEIQPVSDSAVDSAGEPGLTLEGDTNKQKNKNETINNGEEDSSLSTTVDGSVNASHILSEYNRVCIRLPVAKLLTPKRSRAVRARLREHGKEGVLKMLGLAAESDFLAGQNQSNWTASFDWLFMPSNFVKVLEGNYRNKPVKYFHNKPSPFEVIEETYKNIVSNGTFDY